MSTVMIECNLPLHFSGRYQGSFAYLTIKDRLPVILVKVVDSLCQNKALIGTLYGEVATEEVKEIIGRLSGLQNEMVTNKPIKPLTCNSDDVIAWNKYLAKQHKLYDCIPAWFDSSWLYVECYLYRRIKEAFELSSQLKEYDYFRKQKQDAFFSSMEAVTSLAFELQQTFVNLQNSENKSDLYNYFKQYLEISLWGNKCDLSISAGKENVQQCSPLLQLKELRDDILINHTDVVWEILQCEKKNSKKISIDLVLDNAGFELFCDLCFLHFLQTTGLVDRVHLYVKKLPWFVSDALESDIMWLLENLLNSSVENISNLGKEWSNYFSNKQWSIQKNMFWTLPHDYSEMLSEDPNLYCDLSKSSLIIFKGDLNYRKLTGDRQWEETTTFLTALNGFLPSSLVSLRTIKADVVVGLKPGTSDKLSEISQNWKICGKYAVVQCESKN